MSPDTCADLSDADRADLVKKVECAQNNIQNLITSVDQMNNATLREELMRRASLQYLYLEQVKLGIQKQCQQAVIVAPTTYFYNLANPNWIFGSQVKDQDIINTYTTLSQHGSVTICPFETPFVKPGVNNCFACNGATPIFDLTQQACIACPGNTTLNSTTHTCACPCDCYVSSSGYCLPRQVVYLNGNYLNLAGLTSSSIPNYINKINSTLSNPAVLPGKCAQN